jgi:serine/threonine protein kinase
MSSIQQSTAANSHLKKYKKVKYLGKGSYGAAILVELRSNPSQKFVIKEIVIGHLKPAEQEAAKTEAEVLHQMNHSNITSYIESFVESSKLYIVMEHADGGDLSAAIAKRKTDNKFYCEEEAMRIFVQICLALRHIHKQNILHRDLKSQNIFLTSNGMVKLGDFGIAKVLDASEDQAKTQIGTPYYLSPEICESKPYGTKSDIWSLGVVFYEILALEMPFQANSLPALVHRIVSSEPNFKQIESRYSPTLMELLKSLLFKNPDVRPSIHQIVKSDFLKNHISKLLSFTLKSGTGGVANADNVLLPNGRIPSMDADEAEKKLDMARGIAIQPVDAKQLAREQQLERMRNIRQDMANKQRAQPQPPPYVNNNNRPLSPKPNRPLSPKPNSSNNRGLSPKRGPTINNNNNNSNNKNNNVNNNHGGGNNPFGKINHSDAVVAQNNSNNYESVARREYFANRAAAQAFKAKVEANEHGAAMTNLLTNDSDNGYGNGNGNGNRRENFGERELADVSPQTRIAMLKAQKEQDREKEIALKNLQVTELCLANWCL